MPNTQRVVLLLLAAAMVLIAVLLIPALTETGNEGDDQGQATVTRTVTTGTTPSTTTATTPEPETPTIDVRAGEPGGGVRKLNFRKGQKVIFIVTSDVADEVHVHGYDIEQVVPAGGSARLSFKAQSEGIFEIEVHGSGQQIASLHVNPG